MSVPFEKRANACYQFIKSGFMTESTVAWMLKEYGEDDNFVRTKYPGKLDTNIITMGGDGDQRQLNVGAFGNAFRRFQAEVDARAAEAHRVRLESLEQQLARVNSDLSDAYMHANRTTDTGIAQAANIGRLERENAILVLEAKQEPAGVA